MFDYGRNAVNHCDKISICSNYGVQLFYKCYTCSRYVGNIGTPTQLKDNFKKEKNNE